MQKNHTCKTPYVATSAVERVLSNAAEQVSTIVLEWTLNVFPWRSFVQWPLFANISHQHHKVLFLKDKD